MIMGITLGNAEALSLTVFLDRRLRSGVFILTNDRVLPLHGDWRAAKARNQALEDQGSLGRRDVESHAREGQRSQVSGERVLRSARRRAGQVRDVAARLRGERVGNGRRR